MLTIYCGKCGKPYLFIMEAIKCCLVKAGKAERGQ